MHRWTEKVPWFLQAGAQPSEARQYEFWVEGEPAIPPVPICSGDSAECWEAEATIAWHDDPEAKALIDVLRRKLSDLRIFG